MRQLLGTSYADPDAHRAAFATDLEYRRVVRNELSQSSWATGLVEAVNTATALARQAPLLDRALTDVSQWMHWAFPYRKQHGYPVFACLSSPVRVANQ